MKREREREKIDWRENQREKGEIKGCAGNSTMEENAREREEKTRGGREIGKNNTLRRRAAG